MFLCSYSTAACVYRNVLWLPKHLVQVLLCGWQQQLLKCGSGHESRSVEHWGYSVRLAAVPLILVCFRCGKTASAGKVSKLVACCAG